MTWSPLSPVPTGVPPTTYLVEKALRPDARTEFRVGRGRGRGPFWRDVVAAVLAGGLSRGYPGGAVAAVLARPDWTRAADPRAWRHRPAPRPRVRRWRAAVRETARRNEAAPRWSGPPDGIEAAPRWSGPRSMPLVVRAVRGEGARRAGRSAGGTVACGDCVSAETTTGARSAVKARVAQVVRRRHRRMRRRGFPEATGEAPPRSPRCATRPVGSLTPARASRAAAPAGHTAGRASPRPVLTRGRVSRPAPPVLHTARVSPLRLPGSWPRRAAATLGVAPRRQRRRSPDATRPAPPFTSRLPSRPSRAAAHSL